MSMQIIGAEILSSAQETLHFELKLLANERALCIFPSTLATPKVICGWSLGLE